MDFHFARRTIGKHRIHENKLIKRELQLTTIIPCKRSAQHGGLGGECLAYSLAKWIFLFKNILTFIDIIQLVTRIIYFSFNIALSSQTRNICYLQFWTFAEVGILCIDCCQIFIGQVALRPNWNILNVAKSLEYPINICMYII